MKDFRRPVTPPAGALWNADPVRAVWAEQRAGGPPGGAGCGTARVLSGRYRVLSHTSDQIVRVCARARARV